MGLLARRVGGAGSEGSGAERGGGEGSYFGRRRREGTVHVRSGRERRGRQSRQARRERMAVRSSARPAHVFSAKSVRRGRTGGGPVLDRTSCFVDAPWSVGPPAPPSVYAHSFCL